MEKDYYMKHQSNELHNESGFLSQIFIIRTEFPYRSIWAIATELLLRIINIRGMFVQSIFLHITTNVMFGKALAM